MAYESWPRLLNTRNWWLFFAHLKPRQILRNDALRSKIAILLRSDRRHCDFAVWAWRDHGDTAISTLLLSCLLWIDEPPSISRKERGTWSCQPSAWYVWNIQGGTLIVSCFITWKLPLLSAPFHHCKRYYLCDTLLWSHTLQKATHLRHPSQGRRIRQGRMVPTAGRSHGGTSDKFAVVLGGIFRSCPRTSLRSCLSLEISSCNACWGNFLEACFWTPDLLRSCSRSLSCGAYGSPLCERKEVG